MFQYFNKSLIATLRNLYFNNLRKRRKYDRLNFYHNNYCASIGGLFEKR